jgi:hypothetical protein
VSCCVEMNGPMGVLSCEQTDFGAPDTIEGLTSYSLQAPYAWARAIDGLDLGVCHLAMVDLSSSTQNWRRPKM